MTKKGSREAGKHERTSSNNNKNINIYINIYIYISIYIHIYSDIVICHYLTVHRWLKMEEKMLGHISINIEASPPHNNAPPYVLLLL